MFDQAFRALEDSFKVALKAQEDSIKFWSEAVNRAQSGSAVTGDWIPTAQKHAEEYLRLLETSYQRNSELVKKVLGSQKAGPRIGLDKQAREWLEASIAAARANAQDLASTNLRVAQAWTAALQNGAQQGAQFAQRMAQQKSPAGK